MKIISFFLLLTASLSLKAQKEIGKNTFMYSYPVETKTIENKKILVWLLDYEEDIPTRKAIIKKLSNKQFDVIDFRDLFPVHLSFTDQEVDSILVINDIKSIVHLQYSDIGSVERTASTTTYGTLPGTDIPQAQTTGGTYAATVSVDAKLTLYSTDNMNSPICYVTSSSYVGGMGGRTYNMFVRACIRMFVGLQNAKIIK